MRFKTLQDDNNKVSALKLTDIQCSEFDNLREKLCRTNKLLYRGISAKKLAKKLNAKIDNDISTLSKLFMYGEKAYSFFTQDINPIDKQVIKADIQPIFEQISHAVETDSSQENKDENYLEFIAWFAKPENKLIFINTIFNHPQAFTIILHYYQVLHKLDKTDIQNNTQYPLISTTHKYAIAKDFVELDGYILTIIRPEYPLNDDKIKNVIRGLELPVFNEAWIYSDEQEVSIIYGIAVDSILCVDVLHDDGAITYVNPNLFLPINAHLLKNNFLVNKGVNVSLMVDQRDFDINQTNYHSYFYSQSFDRVCGIDDSKQP